MKIDNTYPEKEFKAGELIFRQGDASRALYILVEGQLKVIEDGVDIASISDPGTVVGESAYLIGCERLADLKADTDCRLQVVEDVERFFRENPERALQVARVLAERVRDMDLRFLEVRKQVKRLGGDLPEEESDLPEELKLVRNYLKAWNVSIWGVHRITFSEHCDTHVPHRDLPFHLLSTPSRDEGEDLLQGGGASGGRTPEAVRLPLFIGTMLYLIHPPWMAWSTLSLPIGLRWLGVGLGLGTLPLLWWTFKSLGTNITRTVALRSQHRLVTHGPYGWVRHPLYSSACVSWCGFSLLSQSWFIALTSVLTVAVLVVRTRTEEENLIERFGDEYRDYMNRTGRFLPGL